MPFFPNEQKLISFDYFHGDTIDSENQEQRLVSELIKAITNCFTDSDEAILLQIVRCFHALIVNVICDVHERDLLTAIQTSYNVYLVTKSQNNRNAAKGSLKQAINTIFHRTELQVIAAFLAFIFCVVNLFCPLYDLEQQIDESRCSNWRR